MPNAASKRSSGHWHWSGGHAASWLRSGGAARRKDSSSRDVTLEWRNHMQIASQAVFMSQQCSRALHAGLQHLGHTYRKISLRISKILPKSLKGLLFPRSLSWWMMHCLDCEDVDESLHVLEEASFAFGRRSISMREWEGRSGLAKALGNYIEEWRSYWILFICIESCSCDWPRSPCEGGVMTCEWICGMYSCRL